MRGSGQTLSARQTELEAVGIDCDRRQRERDAPSYLSILIAISASDEGVFTEQGIGGWGWGGQKSQGAEGQGGKN